MGYGFRILGTLALVSLMACSGPTRPEKQENPTSWTFKASPDRVVSLLKDRPDLRFWSARWPDGSETEAGRRSNEWGVYFHRSGGQDHDLGPIVQLHVHVQNAEDEGTRVDVTGSVFHYRTAVRRDLNPCAFPRFLWFGCASCAPVPRDCNSSSPKNPYRARRETLTIPLPPSSVSEYELLQRLGTLLGEPMPPVRKPRILAP